ncbi:uncharacterized protein LOC114736818 [Neltuma alba]|uniref:uncharacterized protein LOC114736818 n=1 Tax=Neltuma alba TaxID=207710 RepID=UPI0010A52947|nr:uncharacterized protein LOC114736818 [Prosopis alba]
MARPKYAFHLFLFLLLFCPLAAFPQGPSGAWLNHGGDLFNRRFASKERKISPETVHKLALKWKFYTGDDVSATPAIFNGTIYFPSRNGNVYAVKEATGFLVWEQNVGNVTGFNATGLSAGASFSRSTPTIVHDADLLITGVYGPAAVMALRRSTGELMWLTRLDPHPAAVITMSGTYYNGSFYVGVSSVEETYSINKCCVFRGSLARLDARSGHILWQTYMLPDNNNQRGDYSGAAIWGSSPSIDPLRNHVYVATGNLYSAPDRIVQCRRRQLNRTVPIEPDPCIETENHSNSMLALDLDSGNITWYHQLGGYDVSSGDCLNASAAPPSCPPLGDDPDTDFAEAPMALTISHANGTKQDIVVAVQKSGIAWALDRDNGNLVWSTKAGPGGAAGGGMWGSATDEARVYTNIVNSDGKNFSLLPSKKTTRGSGWVAMDASNGKILWSTLDPQNLTLGPVSVANDVMFAGSAAPDGSIYGIHAKTGHILWSFETNATVYGGVSINNGCIYVGHGYIVGLVPFFTKGTHVFAFCL